MGSDWCVVEACGLDVDPKAVPSSDLVRRMWECSPVARPLQGGREGREVPPILFLIGAKDRRVPPAQGMHFAETLRQAGMAVRVLNFPEDNHPISGVESEMEAWVNTMLLFLDPTLLSSAR